ncbi:MAG: hypothetical protein OXC63_07575 [Aestuariivita sp.]|nr:hypothetical protein [Aestuariivita sp.]MCY4288434.1 hypothetical protein [Aestuariivita sp.]
MDQKIKTLDDNYASPIAGFSDAFAWKIDLIWTAAKDGAYVRKGWRGESVGRPSARALRKIKWLNTFAYLRTRTWRALVCLTPDRIWYRTLSGMTKPPPAH